MKLKAIQTEKPLKCQLYHQENAGKYEILTNKNLFPENDLLEKAATIFC